MAVIFGNGQGRRFPDCTRCHDLLPSGTEPDQRQAEVLKTFYVLNDLQLIKIGKLKVMKTIIHLTIFLNQAFPELLNKFITVFLTNFLRFQGKKMRLNSYPDTQKMKTQSI